jgi:F420 biosynthesis protein FbiB-like protein
MAADFEHDLLRDGVPAEKALAQVRRSKERLTSAPLAIVLCLDMSEMDVYPDETRQLAERTMAIQSVAAAGQQLLLAAHAEGLAGVWVCSPLFAGNTIQQILSLPESWEPQAMFYIGYPVETVQVRQRKALEEISLFL